MKAFIFFLILLVSFVAKGAIKFSDLPSITNAELDIADIFPVTDVSLGRDKKLSFGELDLRYALPSQTGNAGKFLKTDGTSASWAVGGGGSGAYDVLGSPGSPVSVTAAGGVAINASFLLQTYLVSSGGAVTITANPQIGTGIAPGQNLILFGTSDTDYIILNDGTGLALNGTMNLKNKSSIMLSWTGSEWWEVSRK